MTFYNIHVHLALERKRDPRRFYHRRLRKQKVKVDHYNASLVQTSIDEFGQGYGEEVIEIINGRAVAKRSAFYWGEKRT